MNRFMTAEKINVEPRDYDKNTKTFCFESSDKDIGYPGYKVILRNSKTNKEVQFNFVKADTDGEDTYGWNYRSVCGNYSLLIIND